MPFPNFHSARMKSPGTCTKEVRNQSLGQGIQRIACVSKSTGEWQTQAFRFAKDRWTAAQAREWLREHNHKPILFEAASG